MRRPGSLFLLVLFFAANVDAHPIPSGNLGALGTIWGVLEYAHPWLGYRDVDWDAAAIRAIERVRANPNDLSGALTEMFAVLGDDATFVRPPCVETAAPAVDRSTRMLADGIVYISATSPVDSAALRNARAAVVDLRPQPGRCMAPALAPELVPLLVRGNVARADLRKVKYHGYRSQDPASTEQGFVSGFVTIDTGVESGTGDVAKVVFIVNDRSVIPPFATALAAAETATFVSAGRFPLASTLDHCEIGLPDGMIATLRTSELIDNDGYAAEPSAMITLAADAPEADVMAAALQLAKPRASRRRASGPGALRMPDYQWHRDAKYADMTLPSPEYRILAAFRLWNVVHFFHATPDDEWLLRLGEILTMLEHAETRTQYEVALAEVMALANDGQASVDASAPAAAPPFRLRMVEEKPVVVESRNDSVKAGDELLRIDGRDVSERMTELAPRTSASTDAAKQAAILRALANGAANSQSTFAFRRPDGTTYDVPLMRTVEAFDDPKPWRILEGNVAYVDMRYLDAEEVPILFTEVSGTRAMILDLRNGARDVVAELAKRMNVTRATSMSAMVVPELIGGAFDSATIDQAAGGSSLPTYAGSTIALVDEGTFGHGEEVAVTLATVARTEIVGTPTAGASGTVTSLVVPGNILVRFTGADVRYLDGREVHGIGVLPAYRATRTIHGLAAGHDEVLEKALEIAF